MSSTSEITELLVKLKKGEDGIYDKIYPLIYKDLRQLAYSHMSNQSNGHTLSETALVHETYLKMIDQSEINFTDRSHFLAIASQCMRQILIDYARKKHAKKRGGQKKDVTYIEGLFNTEHRKKQELICIDKALKELKKLDKRLSKVVEMKFFGEMTIAETAKALGISISTVKRDWRKARGWLYKELKGKFEIS